MMVEQDNVAEACCTHVAQQYPRHPPSLEGCVYRGEGNANLVVALPSEHKVIRLRKSLVDEFSQEEDARRACQEVDFIRDVISSFLGCYVCVPEILRYEQTEIVRLSEKIRPLRPEHRRSKEITGTFATMYPDYTFLPENLSGLSQKSTFCVEIKPKQGFICKPDRQFKKCSYCLTQYFKTRIGSTKEPSAYCPLDLFSGQAGRMERALEALLRSPQNNLRIFKDGAIVYDEGLACEDRLQLVLRSWFACERPLEAFVRLVRCALTRPFEPRDGGSTASKLWEAESAALDRIGRARAPCRLKPELVDRVRTLLSLTNQECELSGEELTSGSVLERILRMQALHRCGADVAVWIHAKMPPEILSDELIYADLTGTGHLAASMLCQTIGDIDKVMQRKLNEEYEPDGIIQYKLRNISNSVSSMDDEKNCNNQKEQLQKDNLIGDNLKNLTIHGCYSILENYLLSCTAKDCSILIAFQEVDKVTAEKKEYSEHRIDYSENQSFIFNTRILDLDMKKLSCIEKHLRRDNDVLEATKKELEKYLGFE